jgi:hypothetical protein
LAIESGGMHLLTRDGHSPVPAGIVAIAVKGSFFVVRTITDIDRRNVRGDGRRMRTTDHPEPDGDNRHGQDCPTRPTHTGPPWPERLVEYLPNLKMSMTFSDFLGQKRKKILHAEMLEGHSTIFCRSSTDIHFNQRVLLTGPLQ